ncbi:uncharacterized protein RJT20DRAFT_64536 [Scheffersomyces xylosifermentans]|uniref:uncharacterized protein n=1 Tax=Scheffersomyces xylosifermentans TaxID=1304137 RepID=UPI00315C510C
MVLFGDGHYFMYRLVGRKVKYGSLLRCFNGIVKIGSEIGYFPQIWRRSLIVNGVNIGGSSSIQDYKMYLVHCKYNEIDIETNIFKGTFYELYIKDLLQTWLACYDLVKVGGAYDNGVDIRGKWNLNHFYQKSQEPEMAKDTMKLTATAILKKAVESNSLAPLPKKGHFSLEKDINVLIQCKNVSTKIKAGLVREMIGTYQMHVRQDPPSRNYLFLISKNVLTPQALKILDSTSIPIIHFRVAPLEHTNGEIYDIRNWKGGELMSVYINPKAREYLAGLNMELQMALVQKLARHGI